MKLISLIAVICVIYLLVDKHPFLAGLVAMIPVKILSALYFRGTDILPVVNGLLLGSCITTGVLIILWITLKSA